MRQIVLDTETTGLDPRDGHRLIEVGCLELVERKPTGYHWHYYFNPEREVDAGAVAVHGLDDAFLADKPLFADYADELVEYLRGAELIIHNAAFDVGFINAELIRYGHAVRDIASICTVTDTLALARNTYPGQRNSLDALCKRLGIDNTSRTLHGALLDAELLASVYLAMTGGQTSLGFELEDTQSHCAPDLQRVAPLTVVRANDAELALHSQWIERLGERCKWTSLS